MFHLSTRRVPITVNLSPYTAAIRDEMPRGQFSAFVRAALLDYEDRQNSGGGEHNPVDDLGLVCNAMRTPRCTLCYPEGRPSREDWLEYVDAVRPTHPGEALNRSPGGDGKLEEVIIQRAAWKRLQDSVQARQGDRVDDMLPEPKNFNKRSIWAILRAKFWPF